VCLFVCNDLILHFNVFSLVILTLLSSFPFTLSLDHFISRVHFASHILNFLSKLRPRSIIRHHSHIDRVSEKWDLNFESNLIFSHTNFLSFMFTLSSFLSSSLPLVSTISQITPPLKSIHFFFPSLTLWPAGEIDFNRSLKLKIKIQKDPEKVKEN